MSRKDNRNNIIELSENDVKKMQRTQSLEKRKKEKLEKRRTIKKFEYKLSKKDMIAFAVIIIGIIVYYIISNYHVLGLVFNKNITSEDAAVIETMSTDSIAVGYKDNILIFENGSISVYDGSGDIEWTKKLEEIFSPVITTCENFIQITNKDTGYIYVLDGEYEVGRIKIEGEILSANINKEGTSVVEYSTSGLKTVIGVFDKKGKEIYGLKLDSNTVSTYCISDNSKYLAYAYADISGISLVTKVDVIDLQKLGNEDYVIKTILAKNNELVYKMYWKDNTLQMLLNNYAVTYKVKSDKLSEFDISSLNAVNLDIYNGNISYIVTETNSSNYVLKVSSFSGREKGSKEVKDLPKYFVYNDGLIYVCFQNSIHVYNKWGINVKNYISETTITKPIIFNNGKSVAMCVSNKIVIFNI